MEQYTYNSTIGILSDFEWLIPNYIVRTYKLINIIKKLKSCES